MPTPFDTLKKLEDTFAFHEELNSEQIKWLLKRVRDLTLTVARVESHLSDTAKSYLSAKEFINRSMTDQEAI